MTPEEQRITIAEACEFERTDSWISGWQRKTPDCPNGFPCVLPDFCNDLNAMHEAILAVIDPHFIEQFHEALYDILERDWTPARWHMFSKPCQFYAFAMATAAQRAEAFLRTIGKWKDTL